MLPKGRELGDGELCTGFKGGADGVGGVGQQEREVGLIGLRWYV